MSHENRQVPHTGIKLKDSRLISLHGGDGPFAAAEAFSKLLFVGVSASGAETAC
jgi:hypothetical protein